MQPNISVIIPVKNNPQELAACLRSLKQNNYPNLEIIIIDDGSDADIKSIASGFSCVYIRNNISLGPLRSRLSGVNIAKNEIIAFIDSDCAAPEDWLKNIGKFLDKDIAGIGGIYEYAENKSMFSRFLSLFSVFWFRQWQKGKTDFLLGGNCAYWKDKIKPFASFQGIRMLKTLNSGDDTLFNLEIAQSHELRFIPGLKVKHVFFPLKQYLRRQLNWAFSRTIISWFHPRKKLLATNDFSVKELLLQLFSVLGIVYAVCLSNSALFAFFTLVFLLTHGRPLIYFWKETKNTIFMVYALAVLFFRDIMYISGIVKAIFSIIKQICLNLGETVIIGFNIINPFSPGKLHFFVTRSCNADCGYCFTKGYDDFSAKDMDLKQIAVLTKKIGVIPYLVISGGEPFMRGDIAEICALFYKNALTRFFVLTSNGYFTDKTIDCVKQILYTYPQARLTVQIALDGIGSDHDKIKKLPGSYARAVSTLERLKDLQRTNHKLLINISTVINKDNFEQIKQLSGMIEKQALADFHFVSPLRGRGEHAGLKHMPIGRYFKILRGLDKNHARAGKGAFGFFYKLFYDQALIVMKNILSGKCAKNKCLAWRRIAVIDPGANVLFCELHEETFGNLLTERSLFKIRNSATFRQKAKEIIRGHCYCNWGCAVVANIVSDPRQIFSALFGKKIDLT